VEALSSSDPLQRRLGAYALGEIGPAASEAMPDLAAALEDPVGFVRVWAAAALARVAPSGGESVTVLIAELGNELAFVRSLAAWHLGRLGPAFPGIERALLPLRQLAGDRDPSVGAEAALALGMLEGKGAPPPELKSLSREGTGRPAPRVAGLRLHSLLRDIASTSKHLIDVNGNAFELQAPSGLGQVCTDPTKLRQVLLNLLSLTAAANRARDKSRWNWRCRRKALCLHLPVVRRTSASMSFRAAVRPRRERHSQVHERRAAWPSEVPPTVA